MPPDDAKSREEHHENIRRTKRMLRWMPRRARMHKYPLIGRFAAYARNRSYLWSFRSEHVRPALYVGSILSLMPTLGVQLPLALLMAIVLRMNFMVVGGLQFLTNPVTAPALYYGTYQLGHAIIEASGFGGSVEVAPDAPVLPGAPVDRSEEMTHSAPYPEPAHAPKELKWTSRFGTAINALVLGAVVSGAVLGLVLDLIWRFAAARVVRGRERRANRPPPPAKQS